MGVIVEGKNSQQQAKSKAWSNNNMLYTVVW